MSPTEIAGETARRVDPSPSTRTRHRWTSPTSPLPTALTPSSTTHATVRDEYYRLVEGLQANIESGPRDQLVFGRNEPGFSTAISRGSEP